MNHHVRSRVLVALAAFSLPAGLAAGAVVGAAPAGAAPRTAAVQTGRVATGKATASQTLRVGCGPKAYTTIGAAIGAAASGDTILVCTGSYPENVVVPAGKSLTIRGVGNPVIDGVSSFAGPGVQVLSSGTTIENLTVTGAVGEGILVGATPGHPGVTVSKVTIRGNVVVNNDQGNPTNAAISNSPYAQCNATPQPAPAPAIPGDCGEGIHLLAATHSTVSGNVVTANSGGILVTDENGPTFGNVISGNVVSRNVYDCGVTLAGHNVRAKGGVFANRIAGNWISGNGTQGEGGGVLLATPVPGSGTTIGGAVYNNAIVANRIVGNGLAAITVHSHSPGQDLNGNAIVGNLIGTNNLAPDHDYASLGYYDGKTTGVIVATLSNVSITIQRNVITGNEIGIWLAEIQGATISGASAQANVFHQVTTPVSTAAMP